MDVKGGNRGESRNKIHHTNKRVVNGGDLLELHDEKFRNKAIERVLGAGHSVGGEVLCLVLFSVVYYNIRVGRTFGTRMLLSAWSPAPAPGFLLVWRVFLHEEGIDFALHSD